LTLFSNVINFMWWQNWIWSIITPAFGVTWSFTNHCYMQSCWETGETGVGENICADWYCHGNHDFQYSESE